MAAGTREPRLTWRRRRGGLALVLGVAALAAALALSVSGPRQPVPRLTLTAGFLDTTRALLARALVSAVAARGIEARLVESDTEDEVDKVNSGAVDLALVSSAARIEGRMHVLEIAPLYIEALHLAVKAELAEAVGRSLGALRGRTVDLGPQRSANERLAETVIAFGGLTPGTFAARRLEYPEVEALVERGDPAALPDAVFHLAAVPSRVVRQLVQAAGYRLVALPFAEALRLNAFLSDGHLQNAVLEIAGQHVADTTIPPFTYRTEPAVPPEPLHTLGTRLLLVANADVHAETVERVLDAVFGSRFSLLAEPPLDRSVLALPPRLVRHPGTAAYLQRGQPWMTSERVNELSNWLSIVGGLVGGGLFLWQWRRQRSSARRDETFGSYMLRVATVERRVVDLELSATLRLEPLIELQRELLQVKSEALERFAAGELGGQAALSDLLEPLNAARDHIGDLILHVRENLEERAETEGRSVQTLWTEAVGKPEEPGGSS